MLFFTPVDQIILKFLTINTIFSKLIPASRSTRTYFEKLSPLGCLMQLISYDYPLIFFVYPTLKDRLKAAQSSSVEINSLIKTIYTDITKLSEANTTESAVTATTTTTTMPYARNGNEDISSDHKLLRNMIMTLRCGGILGIQHYLKFISKTKEIPIAQLYLVKVLIQVGKKQKLSTSSLRRLDDEAAEIAESNGGRDKPSHINTWWVQQSFSVYFNNFISGDVSNNYLQQFRAFMVEEIAPRFYMFDEFFITKTLQKILKIELSTGYDDSLLLFNTLFCGLFSEEEECENEAPEEFQHILVCKRCEYLERIIMTAILSITNKAVLEKCYKYLCDEKSEMYGILSKLNKHLIYCWDGEVESSTTIHFNIQCIDIDFARKIIKKHEEILYRDCYIETEQENFNEYRLTPS